MKPTHGNWPQGLCSLYEAEGQHCSGWRRLEAEVERWKGNLANLICRINRDGGQSMTGNLSADADIADTRAAQINADLDEARTEVARLRAENSRLRAQIAEYFAEPDTHPIKEED